MNKTILAFVFVTVFSLENCPCDGKGTLKSLTPDEIMQLDSLKIEYLKQLTKISAPFGIPLNLCEQIISNGQNIKESCIHVQHFDSTAMIRKTFEFSLFKFITARYRENSRGIELEEITIYTKTNQKDSIYLQLSKNGFKRFDDEYFTTWKNGLVQVKIAIKSYGISGIECVDNKIGKYPFEWRIEQSRIY